MTNTTTPKTTLSPDYSVKHVGAKYEANRDLSIAKIAAAIRADIKTAVALGELPKASYSVRSHKSSMHAEINVVISGLPFAALNTEAFFLCDGNRSYPVLDQGEPRYSEAARAAIECVEKIVSAYNEDRSDSSVDYFCVRFYGDVRIDDTAEYEAFRVRLLEAQKIAYMLDRQAKGEAVNDGS